MVFDVQLQAYRGLRIYASFADKQTKLKPGTVPIRSPGEFLNSRCRNPGTQRRMVASPHPLRHISQETCENRNPLQFRIPHYNNPTPVLDSYPAACRTSICCPSISNVSHLAYNLPYRRTERAIVAGHGSLICSSYSFRTDRGFLSKGERYCITNAQS
jgi:hypothetical protein